MLSNPDSAPGIRMGEVFAAMTGELPWPSLRDYIQANTQLAKTCQLGGYRLDVKFRKRFESFILREAEKAAFSSSFCNPVFAQWYPVHQELYRTLEDYFHSDVYKHYRDEQKLPESTYALPADVFDRVFRVEDLDKWRILLCFSPMQFTDEQLKRVLEDARGNDQLLRRVKEQEDALGAANRETAQARLELERFREQLDSANSELQELRKVRRDLQNERNELANKFEASQAENRRIRQQDSQREQETLQRLAETDAGRQQEKNRLEGIIAKLEKETGEWRTRYEQQRGEDRELKDTLQNLEQERARETARAQKAEAAMTELHRFVDAILQRIEWTQIGKKMQLTPLLQRQFNSVLKKLHYEDDLSLTIEGTLPQFAGRLIDQEKQLLDQVAQSNTLEVNHGTVEEFWSGLKETFDDVIIGLEARLMLLKLLKEIFYQVVEMDDLEKPVLPMLAPSRSPRQG
ncbi:MAG: hypothetical protein WC708_17255 [Lentisphaeria bacterium]